MRSLGRAREGKKLVVAIDGPAGAGKSTLAKRLAQELGYTYMDTGAMYRAFAWKVMQDGIDLGNEKGLKEVLKRTRIDLKKEEGGLRVFLDGLDVTDRIRTPELSQMASKVSTVKAVRERMVELQRAMGKEGGIVAEGRDIGTVVFPEAEIKVYLDAAPEERAKRRFEELAAQGKRVNLEETLEEMHERDHRDQERALAPLRKAEGAVVIDSTQLSIDGVMEKIRKEITSKLTI